MQPQLFAQRQFYLAATANQFFSGIGRISIWIFRAVFLVPTARFDRIRFHQYNRNVYAGKEMDSFSLKLLKHDNSPHTTFILGDVHMRRDV